VEIEIVPEPSPAEREALLDALARFDAEPEEPPVYRSRWRRAGLDPDDDEARFG